MTRTEAGCVVYPTTDERRVLVVATPKPDFGRTTPVGHVRCGFATLGLGQESRASLAGFRV